MMKGYTYYAEAVDRLDSAVKVLEARADALLRESERLSKAVTALTQRQNMLDKELNPGFDEDEYGPVEGPEDGDCGEDAEPELFDWDDDEMEDDE